MTEKQTQGSEVLIGTPEEALQRELKREAQVSLLGFFKSGERGRDDIAAARVAAATISALSRDAQTANAGKALDYQMARDLAKDKDQLQEYVRVTMPSAPIVRALSGVSAPTSKAAAQLNAGTATAAQ